VVELILYKEEESKLTCSKGAGAELILFKEEGLKLTLHKGSRGGTYGHPAQDGDTLGYGGQVVEQITSSLKLPEYRLKHCKQRLWMKLKGIFADLLCRVLDSPEVLYLPDDVRRRLEQSGELGLRRLGRLRRNQQEAPLFPDIK